MRLLNCTDQRIQKLLGRIVISFSPRRRGNSKNRGPDRGGTGLISAGGIGCLCAETDGRTNANRNSNKTRCIDERSQVDCALTSSLRLRFRICAMGRARDPLSFDLTGTDERRETKFANSRGRLNEDDYRSKLDQHRIGVSSRSGDT